MGGWSDGEPFLTGYGWSASFCACQVAPAYAATCPTKGQGVLESILIRVANQGGSGSKTVYKVSAERDFFCSSQTCCPHIVEKAVQALEICRQYDLASTSASICQVSRFPVPHPASCFILLINKTVKLLTL